jgi:hypothetical protein
VKAFISLATFGKKEKLTHLVSFRIWVLTLPRNSGVSRLLATASLDGSKTVEPRIGRNHHVAYIFGGIPNRVLKPTSSYSIPGSCQIQLLQLIFQTPSTRAHKILFLNKTLVDVLIPRHTPPDRPDAHSPGGQRDPIPSYYQIHTSSVDT